jgi:hypothetical protein
MMRKFYLWFAATVEKHLVGISIEQECCKKRLFFCNMSWQFARLEIPVNFFWSRLFLSAISFSRKRNGSTPSRRLEKKSQPARGQDRDIAVSLWKYKTHLAMGFASNGKLFFRKNKLFHPDVAFDFVECA